MPFVEYVLEARLESGDTYVNTRERSIVVTYYRTRYDIGVIDVSWEIYNDVV